MARGYDEVGKMVSAYTHLTSPSATAEGEFDEAFKAPVVEAVAQLNLPQHKAYLAGPDCRDPPTYEEVDKALNDLATGLHKSPGIDEVYGWMVVFGGDAVHEALEAMCGKVWTSGVLPDCGMRPGSPTCTRQALRLRCPTTS